MEKRKIIFCSKDRGALIRDEEQRVRPKYTLIKIQIGLKLNEGTQKNSNLEGWAMQITDNSG